MNHKAEAEFDAIVTEPVGEVDVAGEYPDALYGVEPVHPSPHSAEWSDYLLDALEDHELYNGAPTVGGLRRVTEKCFGEILESRSQIVETPSSDNGLRCTICHTLRILKYHNGQIIHVDGCVDVLYHKTPYPFKDHLVATADTRAEGKALRRALKIRVITAEELQHESEEEVILSSEEGVNDQQILAINQLCKRIDVSVSGLVTSQYPSYEAINSLNNLEARVLIARLSDFQRSPDDIEEQCQGYDENWKDTFYRSGA